MFRVSACVAATLAVVLLGGCATRDVPVDTAVMAYPPQYGRSLAFDAGEPTPAGPRWYDVRNDATYEVFAGYDSPRETVVVTREWERLRVYNGRVRDDSHTRTYRESVRHSVR